MQQHSCSWGMKREKGQKMKDLSILVYFLFVWGVFVRKQVIFFSPGRCCWRKDILYMK